MAKKEKPEEDENVPEGICTANGCKCSCFKPRKDAKMYCAQKDCAHSIEWHHLNAKEI